MEGKIDLAIELYNGVQMPWLGLGTWQAAEGAEVESAVKYALEIGYRHIDTAAVYGNEHGVGKAVRESGVPREKIFITSKVWNSDQGYESTLKAYEHSLQLLNTDYLDLYLIHWPVKGKYVETWKALEKIYNERRVKAIGVSNFHIHHLEDLLKEAEIVPMVNQVEFHPYLQQNELRKYCQEHLIRFEAWSPLMQGHFKNIPVIKHIAEKYGKTEAQIILRWDIQNGVVTIPKSVHKERIKENSEIFDFELSGEDMDEINALNQNRRFGPDPDNFNF